MAVMWDLEAQKSLRSDVEKLKLLDNNIPITEASIDALPTGEKVVAINPFPHSAWSYTAKLTAEDGNGKRLSYFLKCVPGELGRQQLRGEFAGMSALHRSAPDFVTPLLGWGKLKSFEPETYFLLAEFKHLNPDLVVPDAVKLGKCVAEMHKHPNNVSPTGMFGFPMQTFDGVRRQIVDWDPSWPSFFSKLLAEAYRQDIETNGPWPELDAVFQRVQSDLIPRLIGALESEGQSITPVLIHGDMWEGNVATEKDTGRLWTYDCAAYYGHNEMELAIWRARRHKMNENHRKEYHRYFPKSEPTKEAEDRNLLYSAKTNFMFSACFPGSPIRQEILDDFVFLLRKYLPGKEKPEDGEPNLPVVAKG